MADVVPYLLGAGTTLVAQTVLQLYVVPTSDLRKRREDRWEQALVDLGDFLAQDASSLGARAMNATTELAAGLPEATVDDTTAAMRAFRLVVNGRVRMLADRVISLAPEHPSIRAFEHALHEYRGAVAALAAHVPGDRRGRQIAGYGEIQSAGMLVERTQLALFDETRHLMRGKPPRPRPVAVRLVSRVQRKLRRR